MPNYWLKKNATSASQGPYPEARVKAMLANGQLGRLALVSEDNSNWIPASRVKGFYPQAAPASASSPVESAPAQSMVEMIAAAVPIPQGARKKAFSPPLASGQILPAEAPVRGGIVSTLRRVPIWVLATAGVGACLLVAGAVAVAIGWHKSAKSVAAVQPQQQIQLSPKAVLQAPASKPVDQAGQQVAVSKQPVSVVNPVPSQRYPQPLKVTMAQAPAPAANLGPTPQHLQQPQGDAPPSPLSPRPQPTQPSPIAAPAPATTPPVANVPHAPPRNASGDLLGGIDAGAQGRAGSWTVTEKGVRSSGAGTDVIAIPGDVPDECDVTLQFVRLTGDQLLGVGLRVNGSNFMVIVGAFRDQRMGIDGPARRLMPVLPNLAKGGKLTPPGEPHQLVIKVRSESLEAELDGKYSFNARANYPAWHLSSRWQAAGNDAISLASFNSSFEFQSLTITPVNGK